MYKATRDFINARQKHTDFKLVIPSKVTQIPVGAPNKCFSNAWKFAEQESAKGNKMRCLSGWLVQPYDVKTNSTAIIQHWWNGDLMGNQFDTTPNIDKNEEYVLDFALYDFCHLNFEKITTNVAMSLLYQNSKYQLLVNEDEMEFVDIKELKTEYLYLHEEFKPVLRPF